MRLSRKVIAWSIHIVVANDVNSRCITFNNVPLTILPEFPTMFALNMSTASLPVISSPDGSWKPVAQYAPPSGKLVLYRTAYYQMLGYVDCMGRWMGSDGKAEELPVQWWRDVGEEPHWSYRYSG